MAKHMTLSREYQFTHGRSRKFWEAHVYRDEEGYWWFEVRWGRLGSRGQEKRKRFASQSAATAAAERRCRVKVDKGYELVGGRGHTPAPSATSATDAPPKPEAPPKAVPEITPTKSWGGGGSLDEIRARFARNPSE